MANYSRMVHSNGQRKSKRTKMGRRTTIKPKYTYWDVLRQADSNPDVQPESGTLRSNVKQNTGMRLDGNFVMFRDKQGQLVFLDENGNMVRK